MLNVRIHKRPKDSGGQVKEAVAELLFVICRCRKAVEGGKWLFSKNLQCDVPWCCASQTRSQWD